MISNKIENEIQRLKLDDSVTSLPISLNILATNSGKIFKANLEVSTHQASIGLAKRWVAQTIGTTSISGVPGTSSPIEIEAPLIGEITPTGASFNTVEVAGLLVRAGKISSMVVPSLTHLLP